VLVTHTGHADVVIRWHQTTRVTQRTGICIVRFEHQGNSELLISFRMNLDIDELSGEWHEHYTDIEQATVALRQFARAFGAGTRRLHVTDGP
jgi:hypothetical protein